jgi:hypothetical protein
MQSAVALIAVVLAASAMPARVRVPAERRHRPWR